LTQVQEHHISVRKTARFAVLGDLDDAREVWFVLHGYGQLAGRFLRRFEPLVGGGRLVVAPEALNRYYFETSPGVHAADAGIGATWMTKEEREREIDDYVAYLDTLYDHVIGGLQRTPTRVVALGFSQGAATAARWIAHRVSRVSDVVLWGGFVPDDVKPSADVFGAARLTLVHGRADRYASESKIARESERLQSGGLTNHVLPFDGGHEIADAPLLDLVRLGAA
jgi:predicted esterase